MLDDAQLLETALAEHGVEIVLLDDQRCMDLMTEFIARRPDVWFEDIGED